MKRPAQLALLVLLVLGVAVQTAAAAPPADRERVPERYIVVYRASVQDVDRATERRERAQGFRSRARYRHALKGFAARLNDRQVQRLREDPEVAFVTVDRPVRASATLAAGDSVPVGVERIEAATDTSVRSASGVNVAVIDSGIDLDHPDLAAVDGTNCVQSGQSADDDNGHGTHVAGTIAARNDGAGVVGVAPGTRVYAVKVLDANGRGTFSDVICGIDWVTATRTDEDPGNDVKVANLSLGASGDPVESCSTTTDALHLAICNSTAAGVVYAVAAGNSGWDFDYEPIPDVPAAYPQVLTVTAMTDADGDPGGLGGSPSCDKGEDDDRYASFSNWAGTTAGAQHTIAAPGVCVTSTWPGGGDAELSGTSMAAPHVAGAVALCIAEGTTSGPCASLAADDPAAHIAELTNDDPAYGFVGDPNDPVGGQSFGPLTWATAKSSEPTEPDSTPPAAPTGLSATAGDAQAALDWADNTEADLAGYEVLRSTTAGGPYTELTGAPISGSSYTDTTAANGTTYFYVVRAVDTFGNASADSGEVSATPERQVDLTATGFKERGRHYAALKWVDADSSEVDVYRDGVKIATTANDGAYTDSLGKARGTFRYLVCEAGSSTDCSNDASVSF